mmetsp:Transcript_8427/g.52699  ORF Transcript_8427/g.52699 Transcript_8427/m.52699 type:complete len:207 (-) Transcript_8427:74-694(-)
MALTFSTCSAGSTSRLNTCPSSVLTVSCILHVLCFLESRCYESDGSGRHGRGTDSICRSIGFGFGSFSDPSIHVGEGKQRTSVSCGGGTKRRHGMEDDSVRVLDKCMLDGHFDETKEKVLKKLQQDEALSTLSEKSIEEAIERLERENPTHWMTDRNVFEKVKQDVEEKIMRAVDVEVWTTLEAPEQREEILRQVEEALGSILLRR